MTGEHVQVSGKEVFDLLAELEPIIANKDRFLVMMGALTLALVAMKPDIETPQLLEGVKGMSEWMAAFMAPTEGLPN